MFIDILLLAVIAGVIFFKLYNILGETSSDDVVIKTVEQKINEVKKEKVDSEEEGAINALPQSFAQKILKIKELSPDFHYGKFLNAVESAFETIIKAFKEYDVEALNFLTDGTAKESFLTNVKNLKEEGKQLNIDIVSIKEKKIEDIKISRTEAKITIRFNTEQIFYTKDSSGNIISGDIHQVEEISDSWVFAKKLGDASPVWKLIATNS